MIEFRVEPPPGGIIGQLFRDTRLDRADLYKPTAAMSRELAYRTRAGADAPPLDYVSDWRCRRRGLIDRLGRVTPQGLRLAVIR